ncbi:hypothetical protein ACN27E_13430 [Mycobacterium sp. WMMD1722]|uniref:hypothetical protein n=1 Tax=Mycobacterium sp. WMMD1722 TaxID=3404117 RepID=UPI003BF503F9
MSDGRMRRKAKRARREARRRKRLETRSAGAEPTEEDVFERVLSSHPLGLLAFSSKEVERATPHRWVLDAEPHESADIPRLVSNLVAGASNPGADAMLAALAFLVDDAQLRDVCRRELAARRDTLSDLAADLTDVHVHTAARMIHVLGDYEYLYLGCRIGTWDLTCEVLLVHDDVTEIVDVAFTCTAVDEVLAGAKKRLGELDYTVQLLTLADARACLDHGLKHSDLLPIRPTALWPACRPLVRALTRHLPECGRRPQPTDAELLLREEVTDEFFTTPAGAPFDNLDGRELLADCADRGTGDPLRWSADRLRSLLCRPSISEYGPRWESILEVPDLLKAFIPFVHARAGVREELTTRALDVIDELRLSYQRAALREHEELVDSDW